MKRITSLLAALALAGCATTYQVAVMPRDTGKIYTGTAQEDAYGQGRISIDIEGKAYAGTWVHTAPDKTWGYVSGGWGWGRRGFGSLGATVLIDNPRGAESKALLTAADGSGLRCDLRSGYGTGGGICRDDRGKEYDVQLRPAPRG